MTDEEYKKYKRVFRPTKEEFDEDMEIALAQAARGEGIPLETAIAELEAEINAELRKRLAEQKGVEDITDEEFQMALDEIENEINNMSPEEIERQDREIEEAIRRDFGD